MEKSKKTYIIVISIIDSFTNLPNSLGFVTTAEDCSYILDQLNKRAWKESLDTKLPSKYSFISNFAVVEGDLKNEFHFIYSTINPNILPAFGWATREEAEQGCKDLKTEYNEDIDFASLRKLTKDFVNKFETIKEYY